MTALASGLLLTGVAALLAGGAQADSRAASPENLLLQVTPDGAGGAQVRGGIDIPAPPSAVWKVMLDCNEAVRYVPKLKSCRVLKADPGGAWDVREHRFDYGVLGEIRHVFRSDYVSGARVRTQRVDGDLKFSQGEWRLEPLAGGAATRVRYQSRSASKTPLPGPLVRQAIRRDAPASLRGLRRRSLAAAGS
ncbi:MAG: SRPBCC family protein [Pseudomonadota bacterium]|nr:SRPBCC family protein [Pseudomonadota bacterium]